MSTAPAPAELPALPILAEAPAAAAAPRRRLPEWLKRPIPEAGGMYATKDLIGELRLETICESGKCPNRSECWTRKTATFMVLGETCTRPCGFCAVPRGKPEAVAHDEPERLAEACARLGLKHVVITSVTRDDLPDGGADHFRRCILAVRARTGATIEVLIARLRRGRGRHRPRSCRPRPRSSTTTWRPWPASSATSAARASTP